MTIDYSPGPDPAPAARRWALPSTPILVGVLALSAVTGAVGIAYASGAPGLQKKLQKAFPNTTITSVDCRQPTRLCEVTAGPNVFYASKDGRYAFVGAVLDVKDRIDLTDKRIKELAAVDNVAGKIGGRPSAPPNAPAPQDPGQALPPSVIKVTLPKTNAIIHHPGAPLKLTAFTDINCGYCKMMFDALRAAPDIELTEYPMEMLNPDSGVKAKLALCAEDRAKSVEALYQGGQVRVSGDCAKAAQMVAQNTAFGRQNGIDGTPTLVRSDGAANPGFMPVDKLRAWLKEAGA